MQNFLSCFRGQPLKEAAGVTAAKSRTATPVTGTGWREGGVEPDPQKRPEVEVWWIKGTRPGVLPGCCCGCGFFTVGGQVILKPCELTSQLPSFENRLSLGLSIAHPNLALTVSTQLLMSGVNFHRFQTAVHTFMASSPHTWSNDVFLSVGSVWQMQTSKD